MAQKKKISPKKSSSKEKTKVANHETESETNKDTDEIEEVEGPKAKKSVDLESALEPAVIIDEKTDDDLPLMSDDEDSSSDELSLDDDELNPFGDKWEQ